jgi:hypothetical protein
MQRLEVSCTVRHIYMTLGGKGALEMTSDSRTRVTRDELIIKKCLPFLYKLPAGLLRA